MRVSRPAAWSVAAVSNDVAILDTAEFGTERCDDGLKERLAYMLAVVNTPACWLSLARRCADRQRPDLYRYARGARYHVDI